jgi:ligand-binding sensor domain-containing protein
MFALVFIVYNTYDAVAQFDRIGFPFHKNFERSEFQAGLQSWMITQAPNGIMYFANNEGLLEFDGVYWHLYPVPDRSIVRSVYASNDGRIYVGTNNHFGYFEHNDTGGLCYRSLSELLPENKRDFGEIWKINKTKFGIVFQSYERLIIYHDDTVSTIDAPNYFHFSFYVNERFFVTDSKLGIYELKNGKLSLLNWSKALQGIEICSILPMEDDLLIASTDNGVFLYSKGQLKKWNNELSQSFLKNQIFSAIRINDSYIAFGTIQEGLIICSNSGQPVFTLNESKGLQNNTILCMATDMENNLWLGTDNGIDLLYLNSPLSRMNRWQKLSAGYTAALYKGYLYLGTNRGLFYKKWDDCIHYPTSLSEFNMIESVKGQVWKLQVLDDRLFCGHNNGTYLINGTHAEKISDIQGGWIYLMPKNKPDQIIGGTYTGLVLFEKKQGKWKFAGKIKGFDESSRIMELDDDSTIWMSHGFKGVYHLRLNDQNDSVVSIDFYDSEKGFKTNYGINVVKLMGSILFFTPDGIYEYNSETDRMYYSEKFNALFDGKTVDFAYEYPNGDIWYFYENNAGVKHLQEDGSYTDICLPFQPLQGLFIGGFQFVYPIDRKHVLLGNENGFIHYDPSQLASYSKPLRVFISEVQLSRTDSVLYRGHLFSSSENEPILRYKDNSLHFFFSAVGYEYAERNQFSTFLKGYDSKWSEWEGRLNREFTNLREGDYEFYVKARNIYDTESETLTFKFKVKPPWSRTQPAYIVYLLLILFFIILIVYFIDKRLKYLRRKEELIQRRKFIEREKELQRDALIAEKEVIKLRNEKLIHEMKTKNKELADQTMLQIQKNKFLINLKAELHRIAAENNDLNSNSNIKKLIRKIDHDINNENNWKILETHFSNVHEEFLTRLKTEYPHISPAELRLCACLRMNISTKDIAGLLNLSVRGIEASRYRLRKTLNLDRSENLTDFILSY